LVLRAVDVAGPARWRWLLTDTDGRFITDHEVNLDQSSALYEAFVDLYGYVRRNRVPDDPVASEAMLVARVGAWIGEHAFGRVGPSLFGTVQVEVPAEAMFLPARPLELAYVDGQPMARRGVSLVYHLPAKAGGTRPVGNKEPVGDRLRILALFSLPSAGSVLALRRERYELARMVREIAGVHRLAIELRVLQYGVTRARLTEAVQEYPGWDVLHLSGHGRAGSILLEHDDGRPDPVTTRELVTLLTPARDRLKLAVLSACESGADLVADTLRVLDLPEAADQVEQGESTPAQPSGGQPGVGQSGADQGGGPGLARGLVDELGVAVLAMRYPVVDSYAIALSGALYPLLLRGGQPVDRAVTLAVPVAAGPEPSMSRPALSIATAALFGPATGLSLKPPRGETTLDVFAERLAGFPPEPVRFVGRSPVLVAANTALAAGSDRAGVWFVGMAGAGKTACALELAHQHRNRFLRLAWWQAPTHPDQQNQALPSLAHAIETQLGVPMMQAVGSDTALRTFLPRLRALLREEALLLVLDNLETLLTSSRTWRDPLWALFMDALLGHGGLSRMVATSRQGPAGLDPDRVLTLATHSLSLAESVLLARELPNLARLLHDEPHPERAPHQVQRDRRLARQVLAVVQGHPKLMELADATAAHSDRLEQALTAATTAGHDTPVNTFFTTGASNLDGPQFLTVLHTWTHTTLDNLTPPARALAELVANVEDHDRSTGVIEAAWSHVWADLWAPHHGDQAPPVDQALIELRAAALIEVLRPDPGASTPVDGDKAEGNGEGGTPGGLRMHPGIAETIRATTIPTHRTHIDQHLAGLWIAAYQHAAAAEQRGQPASRLIVQAGLSAAPYLLRTQRWHDAGFVLEQAALRDRSPEVTMQALGHLRHILDADPEPDRRPGYDGVYARLLARIDPPVARTRLRQAVIDASSRGQHAAASSFAGDLADLLVTQGDPAGALDTVTEKAEFTRLAGLGPWTQASDQVRRLQIITATGHHQQVLDQATTLLHHLDTLPNPHDATTERVQPYNVRETTLDTAHAAALALRDWRRCLDLNQQIHQSQRSRGASAHEQALTRFNDYSPLLNLGRLTEAHQLLQYCQQVLEDAGDIQRLGDVFTARAQLEDARGHPERAVELQYIALRYCYQRPEPNVVAVDHNNLANYLKKTGSDERLVIAHRLAAALLRAASGNTAGYTRTVTGLAADLSTYGETASPTGFADLGTTVDTTPGVRFTEIFARLVPDAAGRDQLLTDTIAGARNHNPTTHHRQQWEPIITAVVAAANGDTRAATDLQPLFDHLANDNDWATLATRLRHIISGNRNHTQLLDGLDDIDTAITQAILDQLQPTPD
jgi:hypothetical protein